MDRRLRRDAGGIRSLAEVLRDHGGALRYDLLALGLRIEDLGTPELSWLDVAATIHYRPLDSALSRSIDGEESLWGLAEQLLAAIADRIEAGNWQRGGGKGSRPKPIMRPGVGPKKTNVSSRSFDSMTIEEFESRNAARSIKQPTTKGG